MTERLLAPLRNSRGAIFWGWWVLLGAIGLQFVGSAFMTQAFGAYVVVLREEFGWSLTLLALGSSLARLESGVLGPPQGWLIDRFGPRTVALVGVVIYAGGLLWFAAIDSPVTFVASYLLLSIGAGLAGYMTVSVAVVNWFNHQRGTALGLMGTGFGFGAIALPLIVLVMTNFGWRITAVISAVAVLVLGLPTAWLLRRRPEDYGDSIDGGRIFLDRQGRVRPEKVDVDFTVGEAMRTRQFWFIALGHGSALLVVSAVVVHLISYINGPLNNPLETAAAIMLALTALQVIGQVVGGPLGDRFNKQVICVLCMAAHALSLVVLAFAQDLWWVLAFCVLHGLAWGIRGPLMNAIRADYFGRASFGKIIGFSSLVIMLGSISGPLVASVVYDLTGEFSAGFLVLAALAAMGSVFFVFCPPPAPPARLRISAATAASESSRVLVEAG